MLKRKRIGMSIGELREALSGNTLSYTTVNVASMVNIIKFVNVELQMDKHTFDYYYEIDVDKLVKSDMPKEELETLREQGWSFSNDGKSLILYLKGN